MKFKVRCSTLKTIFIYKDDGVGGLSIRALMHSLKNSLFSKSYFISTIQANELIYGDWENEAALLIVPGGRDIPYHEKLKGKANQRIRNYIESGGKYLGICAGAYYGSKNIVFEEGKKHEVIAQRELGFFPGTARGSMYPQVPFHYQGHRSAYPTKLKIEDEILYTYYNGGCYFEEAHIFKDRVQSLAHYDDVELENASAIVLCQVGKGKALLSGVHIEVSPMFCKGKENVFKKLSQNEEKRMAYFEKLIGFLI